MPEGASGEDGGERPEFDLTPEEEEEVVARIASAQEAMLEALRKWTHEVHKDAPIPADEVFARAAGVSNGWEQFIVHDLLGISKERFNEILEKKGY